MTDRSDIPDEPNRMRTAFELAGAAVALSAYVVLVGGVREWSRLAAARLPTASIIDSLDPAQLFESGVRRLLVWPVALFLVVLGIEGAAFLARAPQAVGIFKRMARILGIALVVVYAVANGIVSAATLLPSRRPDWRFLPFAAIVFALALSPDWTRPLAARVQARRQRTAGATAAGERDPTRDSPTRLSVDELRRLLAVSAATATDCLKPAKDGKPAPASVQARDPAKCP
jgi:hypothetical protein